MSQRAESPSVRGSEETTASWSRRMPELPIAGFGLLTHFAWEMLQIPWFTGMLEASHGAVVWLCIQATGGDAVILLAGFWIASLVAGRRDWLVTGERRPALIMVLAGIAVTLVFEWLATGPLDRWAYSDQMPVVPLGGVGLLPLMQWILLPPLILWLGRRHILGSMALRRTH